MTAARGRMTAARRRMTAARRRMTTARRRMTAAKRREALRTFYRTAQSVPSSETKYTMPSSAMAGDELMAAEAESL